MMTKTESLAKMKEKGAYDAKELQNQATWGEITETEIIDRELAVPAFNPEKDYSGWDVNAPVADEGQVWLLIQPHNASHSPADRPRSVLCGGWHIPKIPQRQSRMLNLMALAACTRRMSA